MRKTIINGIILVIALLFPIILILLLGGTSLKEMAILILFLIAFIVIGSIPFAIAWVFLPIRLYRKSLVRGIGYFLAGAMAVIFFGIFLIFFLNITSSNEAEYDAASAVLGLLIILVGLFGITSSGGLFFIIILKSRKALKELKQ